MYISSTTAYENRFFWMMYRNSTNETGFSWNAICKLSAVVRTLMWMRTSLHSETFVDRDTPGFGIWLEWLYNKYSEEQPSRTPPIQYGHQYRIIFSENFSPTGPHRNRKSYSLQETHRIQIMDQTSIFMLWMCWLWKRMVALRYRAVVNKFKTKSTHLMIMLPIYRKNKI
jgi:hypothetical protein